jgi:hypothetical protein
MLPDPSFLRMRYLPPRELLFSLGEGEWEGEEAMGASYPPA